MRHIRTLILISLCALLACSCHKSNPIVIIPEPVECTPKHGSFTLNDETFLCFENLKGDDTELAKTINDIFRSTFGIKPNLGDKSSSHRNYILFELNGKEDKNIGNEGYTLTVKRGHILVKANTTAGLFYGFQTLRQMAYPDQLADSKKITIPCAKIKDYPRFAYRGGHLDVSRHFFDVKFVKRYIDLLASYKINKFHWHLTDDHGWRIQIDKYPGLTSIGAWRPARNSWDTLHPVLPGEPATYGGYYTKEQVREVIRYAAARHIDIIPEIEIPGHCSAILATYPQYACDDYPYTVAVGPYWPPKAIMCAGNDDVLTFYKDVLKEVAELFPYPYIHIGGDEAFNDNWQVCPKCQQRIADKHLADETELQQWMMNEIEQYLKKYDKKAIMWDDIVSDDMKNKCAVMCWQGLDVAKTAAKHGNEVILCPTSHCYFNYYQNDPEKEPLAMTGLITLEKAYEFEPMPEGLSQDQEKFILGGQCNLWSEFINTPEQAEYMLLPRLCALAECVWSPASKKDFKNFSNRVSYHQQFLTKTGYNCHK
jgi:hexosaminidase